MMDCNDKIQARLAHWQINGPKRAVVCRLVCPEGTSEIATLAAHEDMPAASVSKLPIVMAFYAQANGAPDDVFSAVRVDSLHFSDEPQSVQALPREMELTPEALIGLAIVSSDNPCADALFRILGPTRIAAFLREAGLSTAARVETGFTDTEVRGDQIHSNRLTAADAAHLIEHMLTTPVYAPLRDRVLPNCILNSRIPALLGDAYVVGHKTGTLTPHGVVNDVGFIRLDAGTLVLSFLCEGEPSVSDASRAIANATRDVVEIIEFESGKT